jgi:tetratricopeptide (TPR) repeat protein
MNTLLGMCEARLDHLDGARAAFVAAMEVNRRAPVLDPSSAYQYVQFLVRSGAAAEALPIIGEVLRHAPDFGPAHLEQAKALERAGNLDAAVASARRALAAAANSPANVRAAHLILARCFFRLGRTAEAEAEQKWIESNPAFPPQ